MQNDNGKTKTVTKPDMRNFWIERNPKPKFRTKPQAVGPLLGHTNDLIEELFRQQILIAVSDTKQKGS